MVVIEAIGFVPQAGAPERVHGIGDLHEVFEELRRHVFIRRADFAAVVRQFERDAQHGSAVKRHPRRAVGLLQGPARRQRFGSVEHADVIKTEESAGKQVFTMGILTVHPPGEIKQ